MLFANYISFVMGIFGCYYVIVILFDLLKSSNKSLEVTTYAIQFDKTEEPVFISDERVEDRRPDNSPTDTNEKKILPQKPSPDGPEASGRSPIIGLGLETLTGEPLTVNAENLSKFMIA